MTSMSRPPAVRASLRRGMAAALVVAVISPTLAAEIFVVPAGRSPLSQPGESFQRPIPARQLLVGKPPEPVGDPEATIAWAEAIYGSGVTVNTLSPGGAVNTRFGTGEITGQGLDPTVIVPMAVWLASAASNGITGCRYTADRWDSNLNADDAAEGCRERAIFPVPTRATPLEKAWT